MELEMCMIYVTGTESGTFYRTQDETETPILFEKKQCDCFLVKYKPDCNHDLKEMCW